MKMRRLLAVILPLAAVALIAVIVAGCGGSSSGTTGGGSAYGNAKPAPKTATGTVSTRETSLAGSSWTPTKSPCTSSRRTRAPPATATARAPASGLR